MKAYTDGSTFPKNPGLGGGAFVAYGNKSNYVKSWHVAERVTNNRIETLAILKLLEFSKNNGIKEIEVFTDSQYAFFGLRRLMKRNAPLSTHTDLWEQIEETLISGTLIITPILVEGHSGVEGNEVADCLAYLAACSERFVDEFIAKENFELFRKTVKSEKKEARKENKRDR
jgi:ribonuclease HI